MSYVPLGFPFTMAVFDVHQLTVDPKTQLAQSLGAVLIGSLVALFLSGAVSMQVFLYFTLYPRDTIRIKSMVSIIWFIDVLHSCMTIAANWDYLINHFGDWDTIDKITWSIAVSVALTASITFFVHCFFIHRIYSLSRKNLIITVPLVLLALVRLISAAISTSEMIRLESYIGFVTGFDYVFTIGLSTAASLDIFITIGLCYYLRRGRSGLGSLTNSMDKIIDTITLYTIENGMLTCVTTVISLICWLTMPTNLIFLGLHFAISKLYANSFLATLNSRKSLLNKSQASSGGGDHPLPVLFPSSFQSRRANTIWSQRSQGETRLQVTVEKTVQHEIDSGEPSDSGTSSHGAPNRHSRSGRGHARGVRNSDPTALDLDLNLDLDVDISKSPPAAYLPN